MIPNDLALAADEALTLLAKRNLSSGLKASAERLQKVVSTYRGSADYFMPIDFTESDLKESTEVFTNAAKKDIPDFLVKASGCFERHRKCMDAANDSDDRTKCRTMLIIDLATTIAPLLK